MVEAAALLLVEPHHRDMVEEVGTLTLVHIKRRAFSHHGAATVSSMATTWCLNKADPDGIHHHLLIIIATETVIMASIVRGMAVMTIITAARGLPGITTRMTKDTEIGAAMDGIIVEKEIDQGVQTVGLDGQTQRETHTVSRIETDSDMRDGRIRGSNPPCCTLFTMAKHWMQPTYQISDMVIFLQLVLFDIRPSPCFTSFSSTLFGFRLLNIESLVT